MLANVCYFKVQKQVLEFTRNASPEQTNIFD